MLNALHMLLLILRVILSDVLYSHFMMRKLRLSVVKYFAMPSKWQKQEFSSKVW